MSSGTVIAGALVLVAGVGVGCTWARTATASRALQHAGRALTIEVHEPSRVTRTQWPITVGVPLPPGLVKDVFGLTIAGDAGPVPSQARALSRWPDGSVRWALMDWQMDLQPKQTRRWHLATGSVAPPRAVTTNDTADRIEVDTGSLQFSVAKNRFAPLSDVRVNGTRFPVGSLGSFFDIDGKRVEAQAPSSVTVTEPGPLRVRIEMRGHYAGAFDYVVRIDAFANQPFVRVLHTFEQHSPQAYTFVRQLALTLPMQLDGRISYSAGREKGGVLAGVIPEAGLTLFQEDNETLHVGAQREADRATGWIDVHDETRGVALAARYFWQEYPQGFDVRPGGVLTYNLWAPGAPPAKVGVGAAKTHELTLSFHGKTPPAPALLAALAEPLIGHVDPQWTVASGALPNSIVPSAATNSFLSALSTGFRAYETQAANDGWDDNGEVRCAPSGTPGTPTLPAPSRPRRGHFGMFNWGDWNFPGFHDTTKGCDAWGNLEYDMTQVLALAYAASGERAYYERMVAAARHFMDVDRIYHLPERPVWVGMNHPKNPLHFTFELGGVDLGHTWTEGLLSYYYLTGDERGLAAARGIADYLVHRSRSAGLRGNPRQWGWPQIALVATYEATGEAAYREAALTYARGGMATFPPDKMAGWKLGILADGLAYTHSLTRDATIQAWLLRYATTVGAQERGAMDPRFLPAVAYVKRFDRSQTPTHVLDGAAARLKFGTWGKPFTIAGRLGFRLLSLETASAR